MGRMTDKQTDNRMYIYTRNRGIILVGWTRNLTAVEECLAGICFFLSNSVSLYTATKIPFIFFRKGIARGLSPNSHIHVSVSDLYIPRIKGLVFLSNSPLHCNENPIYVFPEKELRGLNLNFHTFMFCERFIPWTADRSTYFPAAE
jgi:hypothetical protein